MSQRPHCRHCSMAPAGPPAQRRARAKVRRPRVIPPGRAGLRGRGGASRGRPGAPAPPSVPPLPPRAPRGPPLPPTCGRAVGAGQRAASSAHTHESAWAPGRAPRRPPPQRSAISAAGRRILRAGRPVAAAVPAPPETKARRVACSARPGPGPSSPPPPPPPLCSPRLRAPRSKLRLRGSAAPGHWGRGGAGGAATGGAGRRRGAGWAPPRDPGTAPAPAPLPAPLPPAKVAEGWGSGPAGALLAEPGLWGALRPGQETSPTE
ncbi:wiskott-Aldrich syndrome protein homolog 1-like [Phyllostomus discolor]|uniref:Wiskott-Aldrich syndrome protein homolog 1-like n=1 Tax=Phyllostomus discolor TaxID=89673 RepID=A0A7E6DGZ3_9CHIR|nr:wiskott-Aldrich syndrome protein homolog 1-like [Phyllostomus discolor]